LQMPKRTIEVIDHDKNWALEFRKLRVLFLSHLGSEITSVEHVGSTSVPGLAAKPILDIDIIIEDNVEIEKKVIDKLAELGYIHLGDLGITGREAFKRKDDNTPEDGSGRNWQKHNLYLCRKNFLELRNHLAFRNFLRNDPGKSSQYGELKKRLAAEFPHDIDSYVDGKTDFIINILKQVDLSREEADLVSLENKLKE
jgi:GrpB-like predicted nucleotidyltransferase (UPF0157 family)